MVGGIFLAGAVALLLPQVARMFAPGAFKTISPAEPEAVPPAEELGRERVVSE